MLAKDIMTVDVVTVAPDTPVSEVAATFLDRRISAVPVSSDGKSVIGIVSEGDLMRRPEADTDQRNPSWWLTVLSDGSELASDFKKTHGQTAADVMTKNAIVIDEQMPVAEIAEILEKNHIKRVPVMRDGALIGIVSRANLLRALAAPARTPPLTPAIESDEAIHDALMAALADEAWVETRHGKRHRVGRRRPTLGAREIGRAGRCLRSRRTGNTGRQIRRESYQRQL